MRISPNMFLNNMSGIGSMLRTSSAIAGRGRTGSTASYAAAKAKYNVNNYYNRQAAGYTNIGSAAESLRSTAASFASKSSANVFSAARKNGTTDGLLSQARGMVTSYNNTVKGLNGTPTSLNRVYGQMMQNAFRENRDSLKEIGITVNRDNTVSLNEKKFKAAGVDTIEKVLGAEGDFSSRIEFISENAANNAIRNASGYGYAGQYDVNGAYLSALLGVGSRYNFWS